VRAVHLELPCPNWSSHGLKAETNFMKQLRACSVLLHNRTIKLLLYVTRGFFFVFVFEC